MNADRTDPSVETLSRAFRALAHPRRLTSVRDLLADLVAVIMYWPRGAAG